MKRKNILFVLTDDQGAWAMHCAGNDDIHTPNLDRLAASGVRYENFHCASPVCSPARASILTGKIPSSHGVHDWLDKGQVDESSLSDDMLEAFQMDDPPADYRWPKHSLKGDKGIRYLDGHKTFTEVLHDNGYVCALSGKWHIGAADQKQAGFDVWETTAIGGADYYFQVVLKDGKMRPIPGEYVTDYITDRAIDFLDGRDREKPFCLCVHYTAPHSPWGEGCHPEEYMKMYRDCNFDSIPEEPPHPWSPNADKTWAEWSAVPHPGVRFIRAKYAPIRETWSQYRLESLRGYFAAVTAMDAALGRLMDRLEVDGLLEETLIIFTSDNGSNMGHHGIFGKGNGTYPVNMYRTSTCVPAIFSCPGTIPGGRVLPHLRSHYDLYETLLDFVGIPFTKGEDMPGESFAPELCGTENRADGDRDAVVYDEYGNTRMICARDGGRYRKLILRGEDGPKEYYDLSTDPDERNNRIDDPSCAADIKDLKARMEAFFLRYVNPELDGSKEDVRGKGQITSHLFIH